MFRVVPDQLRISEGWVRCGNCDEVFDANAHLRNLHAMAALLGSAPDSHEATQLMPLKAEPEPDYDWGTVLSAPPAEPVPAYNWQSDPFLEHSPQDIPAADELVDTMLLPLEPQAAQPDIALIGSAGANPRVHNLQELAPEAEDAPVSEQAPLSFMKPAATVAGSRPWLGRKALLAACTVLSLALLVQALLQERDTLAARAPALRPLLQAGCQWLACKVSPLRDIEAIAIDSSAFTSVRPGVYLLRATLKNAAATELATPALELTLTDAQDQPLLRRVLLPAEISSKAALSAGAELSTNLPIAVQSGAVPEKIAGYKLLAFYP